MRFTGKTALITGASRGLGLALAETLAAQGARVVLVARDPEALAAAVARVQGQGGQALGITADLGDEAELLRLVDQVHELGELDLLINNAGTLGAVPLPLILDLQAEELLLALRVNALAPFLLMRAFVGGMVLRGEGAVLNISSDAAREAYPTWGAYAASKAALERLAATLAAEIEDSGVRILTVDPGEMDTRMHADAMPDADPSTLSRPADVAARLVALL